MERLFFQEMAVGVNSAPLHRNSSQVGSQDISNPIIRAANGALGLIVVLLILSIIATPFFVIGKLTYSAPSVKATINDVYTSVNSAAPAKEVMYASDSVSHSNVTKVKPAGILYAGK